MSKHRLLLAKLENLMQAIKELEDHADFGQGAAAKIQAIKRDFNQFVQHMNKIRKKVKQNAAKSTNNIQRQRDRG